MDDLSQRIRRLTPEQRELLFRSLPTAADSSAPMRILPRPQSVDGPLSFAQQRLWFLDQLSLTGGTYHIPLMLELRGPLSLVAIQRSLQSIVDRHEVLRASFPAIGGIPRQRISKRLECDLPVISLEQESPDRQQLAIQQLLDVSTRQQFSLESGQLFRTSLVRLAPDLHVLMLVLHHIVADGWSLGIIIDELAAFYTADCCGVPPELAPLSIQYPDFADWQQSNWTAGKMEQDVEFWLERLREMKPLELPTDHPRPSIQSFQGESCSILLSPALSRQLQDYCRDERVTLFSTLLTTFHVLLAQFSGQRDVSVGTPVAGRCHAELEQLVGCFVNTLVLRADVAGDPSFREFLRRGHDQTLTAFAHQELPVEKLVERLRPVRDPARTPLVQVLFAVHNVPSAVREIPAIQLRCLEFQSRSARFDLEVNIWELQQGVRIIATFDSCLFERRTVEHLLVHFQLLLETIVSDSSLPLSRLPALSGERSQVSLQTWRWAIQPRPTEQESEMDDKSQRLKQMDPLPPSHEPHAPQTEMERKVSEIWAQLLGQPVVSRFDDFFLLGGDSLLAARTVRRLSEVLEIHLDVRSLFETSTVMSFAAHAELIRWASRSRSRGTTEEIQGF